MTAALPSVVPPSPPLVKICGVRTLAGAQAAVDAGADVISFIFYPPARRYVAPAHVAALLRQVRGRSGVLAVGVFVNPELAAVAEAVALCGLDAVQLAGDEAPEFVTALGQPVLKVFRPAADGSFPPFAPGLLAALLESPRAGWGGSGVALDWSLARAVTARPDRPPVFLAGGLHPGNVADAIRAVAPDGVDVSSGVERDGAQDPDRIAAFVAAAKGAWR